MIKLTGIALLAVVLNSRCASHDPAMDPAINPLAATNELAAGTAQEPVILEADAEGIGKATITDRTILVKLPAGYAKTTVRLTYKTSEGVKKITPASGQDIPVRSAQAPTVCIQNDALGNCTVGYQLVIQATGTLTATLDPVSRQLDVTRYQQPYELLFQLGNLNAQTGVTRRFQVRFVNKTTGYSYVGENYMVTDKTGNVVFINQPNSPVPAEARLQMTGTLPLDMPTGSYAVTILMPTCYSPTADGRCLSTGTEGVDLAEPFILRPGPALIGDVTAVSATTGDLLIRGRNFTTGKPIAVRFTSGFTQPADAEATPESETNARLTLPASVSAGQYRIDVTPAGGQPYSTLYTVPGAKAQPSFAYVAPFGSYVATQNGFPQLPAFKGGEILEVRYATGAATVKAMRLIDTKDPAHAVDLTGNTAFRPYAGATDFVMWKWNVPTSISSGIYALVFETADGKQSTPYYQTIRVE